MNTNDNITTKVVEIFFHLDFLDEVLGDTLGGFWDWGVSRDEVMAMVDHCYELLWATLDGHANEFEIRRAARVEQERMIDAFERQPRVVHYPSALFEFERHTYDGYDYYQSYVVDEPSYIDELEELYA